MTTTEIPLPLAAEATTSRRREVGQLPAVLRSEWIKLSTIRTTKVIVAASAVVSFLTSWATAVFVTGEVLTAAEVATGASALTAVLAAIAGILLVSAEVQHGTLAAALTAHPSRWPVTTAKVVVATGYGVVLGSVGLFTGVAGALAGGLGVGAGTGFGVMVLWALLYTAGAAVLGLGVGMVVRHSAGAISGLLVWWLVVESLIVQFAPGEVVRFMPFDTGWRSLGIESEFDTPEVVASALPSVAHAAIFWGYVAAALAIGSLLLQRRDVD